MHSVRDTLAGFRTNVTPSEIFAASAPKAKPITFGLELEFNLAFHETELTAVLNRHKIPHNKAGGASSVKSFTETQHRDLLTTIQDEPSHQCREHYPSWAISTTLDRDDPYFAEASDMRLQTSQHSAGLVRRYMAEHLLIARDAIKQQNPTAQIDVCAFMRRGKNTPLPNAGKGDYLRCQSANLSNWTLTNDHTLMGSLKSQLSQSLSQQINDKNIDDWDSAGIELISPVLQLAEKHDAINTLGKYLACLQQGQKVGILKSKWAGMHTHIGLNTNTPEELDANNLFFQHLVYILASTEDLISACFPRKCSGLKPQASVETVQEVESTPARDTPQVASLKAQIAALESGPANETMAEQNNRIDRQMELEEELYKLIPFEDGEEESEVQTKTDQEKEKENEQAVLKAESLYTGYGSINSNARYLASTLGTQYPIPQETLSNAIFKQGQSFIDLINIFQSPLDPKQPNAERFRGYMYNFAPLHNIALGKNISETWKVPKPTIEFRQHECTIDADEVGHWVSLTEAIVNKAAELAGREATRIGGSPYVAVESAKYTDSFPPQSMTEYCAWLGLGDVEGGYWERRYWRNFQDRPEE